MEFHEKDTISLYLSDLHKIEEFVSSKQKLTMYQHKELGYVFTINDEIQHIEKYQALYHEMLVHLPASFISEPETALIIGGGSLFAANELLKYPSIKSVTLCDYDLAVLNMMKKYYTHANDVLRCNRFSYVECDGLQFIRENEKQYDIIINDCFNLALESQAKEINLFDELYESLTENGISCDIIYRHIFDRKTTIVTLKELRKYSNIAFSLVSVPEYPGVLHLETMWGKNKNLFQKQKKVYNKFQQTIIASNQNPFDYYAPAYLQHYLYLPPYISKQFII